MTSRFAVIPDPTVAPRTSGRSQDRAEAPSPRDDDAAAERPIDNGSAAAGGDSALGFGDWFVTLEPKTAGAATPSKGPDQTSHSAKGAVEDGAGAARQSLAADSARHAVFGPAARLAQRLSQIEGVVPASAARSADGTQADPADLAAGPDGRTTRALGRLDTSMGIGRGGALPLSTPMPATDKIVTFVDLRTDFRPETMADDGAGAKATSATGGEVKGEVVGMPDAAAPTKVEAPATANAGRPISGFVQTAIVSPIATNMPGLLATGADPKTARPIGRLDASMGIGRFGTLPLSTQSQATDKVVTFVDLRTDFRPETIADEGVGSKPLAVAASAKASFPIATDTPGLNEATSMLMRSSGLDRTSGQDEAQDIEGPTPGDRTQMSQKARSAAQDSSFVSVIGKGDDEAALKTDGPPSPTHQIASAIGGQIAGMTGAASSGVASGRSSAAPADPALRGAPGQNLRLRAGGAALKTLQIQLQPVQMGTIDVTMKLVNGQLQLHLVASEAATAMQLKDDKATLHSLLSKSGFDVDDAAITVAARDPAVIGQQQGGSAAARRAEGDASNDGGGSSAFAGQGNGANDGQGAARSAPRRPELLGTSSEQPAATSEAASRRHDGATTYL